MTKPIIYLQRTFREEFIDKIHTIAPEYQIKTELTNADLSVVEVGTVDFSRGGLFTVKGFF